MDKLSCIKAFINIAEQGSVQAAAKKLCLTNAAVSKQLSKLEHLLNTRLVNRGNKLQVLTDTGASYYKTTKHLLESLEQAEQVINVSNSCPKGKLTILMSRYLFPEFIAPKLDEFTRLYPDLHLRFNTAERTYNFVDEDVDILFAIAMPPPNIDQLMKIKMDYGYTRNVVCATPQYLSKNGIPKKPKDLLRYRYLCHVGQYPLNTIYFDDNQEIVVNPFLNFDETDAIIAACKEHLGYIAVREFKITNELKSGELIEVLKSYNKDKVVRYTYFKKSKRLDPKIRAFLDFFVQPLK